MKRFQDRPLLFKVAAVALPLALLGAWASALSISTYKQHKPAVAVSVIKQSDPAYVLGDTTTYPPPDGSYPSTCPSGYTGTPPNCQPTSGSGSTAPPPSSTPPPDGSYPSTCPSGYTGTPPNCQPSGSSSGGPGSPYQPYSPPNGSSPGSPGNYPQAPPTFSVTNTNSCLSSVLGQDAASHYQSGGFQPTPAQIAAAQSCFSAQVNFGPPPAGSPGQGGNPAGSGQPFANIPIAAPAAFQPNSPAVACAQSILGSSFGSPQISQDQMNEVQRKCFPGSGSGNPIGFVDPSGRSYNGQLPGGNQPGGQNLGRPQIPPEVEACVVKAGISKDDINAISNGKPPTAAQQSAGEGCFKDYAKKNNLTAPTLTPPDPSQPLDSNSKQAQCAGLVAQAHGLKFSDITPAKVVSWSADDLGKLRSCFGVPPGSSTGTNAVPFAPDTPQVAISSSKLNCIQSALGKDKLAAVVAGTANISDNDRQNVYNQCINPNKLASKSDPTLLGVLAAMPLSPLEGQFVPVDSQTLPAPTASDANTGPNGEVTVGGELDVKDGVTQPTHVDVFVQSEPKIFTVALKKINATKAQWTVKLAQYKLNTGNHRAFAVATLGDATQLRSPDAKFAIATAQPKAKSHGAAIIEIVVASLAAVAGGWYAWYRHHKHHSGLHHPPHNAQAA